MAVMSLNDDMSQRFGGKSSTALDTGAVLEHNIPTRLGRASQWSRSARESAFLVLCLPFRDQLGNIHPVRTNHIAAMTAQAVFHPLGIAGHAFAAKPLHIRPRAFGPG